MERRRGAVKDYAWGSTSAIPALFDTVESKTPVAELWLGTQNTNIDDHRELGEPMIAESKLEARRKVRGPIYPRIKKGSIVLRDLRLWLV